MTALTTTLIAPAGVTGTVFVLGQSFVIGTDGRITVPSVYVPELLRDGFTFPDDDTQPAGICDVTFNFQGTTQPSEILDYPFAHGATFAANFAGSVAFCRVLATADTSFDIVKTSGGVETVVGTLVFTHGSSVGSFVSASAVSVSQGDLLSLRGPATPDATLAGISATLTGTRTS